MPFASFNPTRDHPFKTSAFFRGGGVNNLPNWAGWVLGLVELIDAKGIGLAQPIWP